MTVQTENYVIVTSVPLKDAYFSSGVYHIKGKKCRDAFSICRSFNGELMVSYHDPEGNYHMFRMRRGQKAGIVFRCTAVRIDYHDEFTTVHIPKNTRKAFRVMQSCS